MDLAGVETKRCEELSKGMQQKMQFIAAVIHQPDLLILDEPFSGLDPINQRLLRDLVLEEHRRGATVLFSTHVMIHAEQLCDHVVMIHKGEKVLDETIAGIRAQFDPRSILFEPMDPEADLSPLESVAGVLAVTRDGAAWNLSLQERADPASVIRAVAAAVAPMRIEVRRPTLEDIFVAIVEGSAPAAGDERTRLRASLRENGHAAGGEAMKKILHIAYREFAATVMTKGFIIGMLITPVMIGIVVLVFPRMMNRTPPKVVGEIAVMDPTGQVTEGLRAYLRPERFVERREASSRQAAEATPEAVKKVVASSPAGQEAMQRQIAAAFGEVPQLDVVALDPGTDLEQAKAPLKAAGAAIAANGAETPGADRRAPGRGAPRGRQGALRQLRPLCAQQTRRPHRGRHPRRPARCHRRSARSGLRFEAQRDRGVDTGGPPAIAHGDGGGRAGYQ